MSTKEQGWGSLNSKKVESLSQRQLLINSSDNDSDDEEWIQQLERDYGKRQLKKTKRLSKLEKILIVSVVNCALLIAFLLTCLLYSRYKHGETLLEFTLGGQKFCDSPACVQASNRILTYIDKQADPCDSFYSHACAGFANEENKHSAHWRVQAENEAQITRIVESLHADEDSVIARKVKVFYDACLRKDFIEQTANASLIGLINYVESWSVTNTSSWNEEQWNFGQSLTRIHHLKGTPLFSMNVAADDRNSSNYIIQIQQSGSTLDDDKIYSRPPSDKVVTAYKKLMVKAALLLGAERESAEKQMEEVFEFEKKLASLYEDESKIEKPEDVYHKMIVADLLTLCPAIPWLDFLNSMFSHPVKSAEPVVVYTPNFLKRMSEEVIKTERRIIANYMVWHLIKPYLPLFSKPYRMASQEFGDNQRMSSCVKNLQSTLGYATGHLFVKHMEKEGTFKKQAGTLVGRVKEAFKLILHSVSWMDDTTRGRAIEKANSIVELVGYPDWIQDSSKVKRFYENLTVTDDPLKNFFNSQEFLHEKMMSKRGKTVDRHEWEVTPAEVNAYFNQPSNQLVIPAGILKRPFFNSFLPSSLNYGALGAVVGHELIHGFDSQGVHFDSHGNLYNWWSNKTKESFFNRTQCLAEKIKKPYDLREYVADMGGLKMALNAFRSDVYVHGQDKLLPGLRFSTNQMFYMSYAQTWCTVDKNREEIKRRVETVLQNDEEFAGAFKCARGTKMNPPTKCSVW